jgi:hypothetical protein
MATCTEASRWAHGFGGAAKKLSLTLAPFWGCVKPAPMSTMAFVLEPFLCLILVVSPIVTYRGSDTRDSVTVTTIRKSLMFCNTCVIVDGYITIGGAAVRRAPQPAPAIPCPPQLIS